MSIIIGADLVPTESNIQLFINNEIETLVGKELQQILSQADYRVFNLEVPLTNKKTPIDKYGPSLIASPDCVCGMKAIGINLFTLANNHIMDQSSEGLLSTLQSLDNAGISHVGAGKNLDEAKEPVYFNIKGKCYGIYACAEHEFSIAGEEKPGANPFDPLESLDHVAQMKSKCDYAIVLYHGGKEHYRYPSPQLQKTCRKIIEKGADIVVCQHSHCIGCKEQYLHGTIVYGQGNFIFDHQSNEYWNTGIIIKIHDDDNIEYIPIVKINNCIRLAKDKDADEIISGFEKRSNDIKQLGFVERQYSIFANELLPGYLLYFLGIQKNNIYRAINKISGQKFRYYFANRIIKKRGLGLRNYIECEAHRELLLRGLEQDKNE